MADVPDVDSELVSRIIESSRRRLAATIIAPIRDRLGYASVARKAFLVEELVPCGSCGSLSASDGAAAGCGECVSRHVMDE